MDLKSIGGNLVTVQVCSSAPVSAGFPFHGNPTLWHERKGGFKCNDNLSDAVEKLSKKSLEYVPLLW